MEVEEEVGGGAGACVAWGRRWGLGDSLLAEEEGVRCVEGEGVDVEVGRGGGGVEVGPCEGEGWKV